MKKKIGLLLLLITVVSVGAVFADSPPIRMWAPGNSEVTVGNLRVGQYITAKFVSAEPDKNRIVFFYESNTRMMLGGRFSFWVYYNDGTAEFFTNSETLINADKTYWFNLKTKKANQVQGIWISFEERVKDKPYNPPPPKEKKNWIDRMFPPMYLP